MMISDDPDEDADTLDDDTLLRQYLGAETQAPAGSMPDWPPRARDNEVGLTIDAQTSDWFRQHHIDWRRAMRTVLRAWVVAQAQNDPAGH